MHVALTKQDILGEIFDTLSDSLERVHLLHAALTCRTFSTPALAALWRRLHSVLPLLQLLSSFRKKDDSDEYVLDGRVPSHELAHFKEYGRYVRELETDPLENIDPLVYFRLLQLCRSPLLPFLRRLDWIVEDTFMAEPLVFITPTLVRLEITLAMEDVQPEPICALEGFIVAVVDEVPSLRHLSIQGDISTACLRSTTHLKNLQSLSIIAFGDASGQDSPPHGLVTADMYRAFQSMENLVSIAIDTRNLHLDHAAPSSLIFKTLDKIQLFGPSPRICGLLITLNAPQLTSIIMDTQCEGIDDCQLLFTSLRFRSLSTIRVMVRKLEGPNEAASVVALDIFALILTLDQLTTVMILLDDIVINMDDELLSSAASAWPRIGILNITCKPGDSLPTLRGLASLAHHCPSLMHLTLPVNTTKNLPSQPPIFDHNLKYLTLKHPVPNAPETARVLDCMFPHLCSVTEVDEGEYKFKFEVLRHLNLFKRVREDYQRRNESLPTSNLDCLDSSLQLDAPNIEAVAW